MKEEFASRPPMPDGRARNRQDIACERAGPDRTFGINAVMLSSSTTMCYRVGDDAASDGAVQPVL